MGVEKILASLARRLRLTVSRAVVRLVDDSLKLQGVQISLLSGELAEHVEHFQHYGFTSVPEPGAQAIALAVGGNRGHLVVIATGDRRHRKKDMQPGEVAVYHKAGGHVYFKVNGDLELSAPGKVIVLAQGDAEVTAQGAVKVTGAGIEHDGGTGAPLGVVQAGCVCAFTGAPHPQFSTNVKASL